MGYVDTLKIAQMNKRDQIIISAFIVAYFFLILIDTSADCPMRRYFRKSTHPIEVMLGIDQSWRMFCPNPRDFNFHPYTVITFEDGSTAYYEFPRPDQMNQLEALLRERLRKHFWDILPWDDYKVFRPTIGRYIARSFYNPNNQPVRVSFCFNRIDLGRIPKIVPRDHLSPGTSRHIYFVYQVSPEDFK